MSDKMDSIYNYHFWRHRIPLGNNTYTPGVRHEDQWNDLHFPEDLKGMSFLDAGANDGMYSFIAESKGAGDIVATDIYHDDKHNWEMTNGWPNYGILTAKNYLGSKVEVHSLSVYDLDKLNRKFDYIFCGNVIIWLNDPYGAHVKLASLANKVLHLREDMIVGEGPAQMRFSKLWKPGSAIPLFAANKTYYREVFKAAGFTSVEFYEVDEDRQWREFVTRCPKVSLMANTNTYLLPRDTSPMGMLNEAKTGRISERVNGKAYIVGIGWVAESDCTMIKEDLSAPSLFQRMKKALKRWREGENREANMAIIARR